MIWPWRSWSRSPSDNQERILKLILHFDCFSKNVFPTLREIIGLSYSGLYGNNTCDNLYGIFARLLRNFYLTILVGNNRLAKVCLRGPRFLAEHFSHRSMEIFPVITCDYCSEVNQVKFPKDFSQCTSHKLNHLVKCRIFLS